MGCTDTAIKHLTISDDYWIYIPNSFTPDSDQINDKLCISYNGIREESFLFNIYNRNSEVVVSTNSIAELNCNNGWEGRHQETNKKLPQGIYVYTIYYQDFEGWKHQNTSTINLIR
jgi:gliding motility-associated-like protein